MNNKKQDQRKAGIQMTGEERWNLAFELIELGIALHPIEQLPANDEPIQWIELKFRNGFNKEYSKKNLYPPQRSRLNKHKKI